MAFQVASPILHMGFGVIMGSSSRSLRSQLRHANSLGVAYVIIIGEEEFATRTLTLRHMASGEQQTVDVEEFFRSLARNNLS